MRPSFHVYAGLLSLSLAPLCSAQLAERFEAEKVQFSRASGSSPSLSLEERRAFGSYDYILIDGILGDLTQDLYQASAAYLRAELSADVRMLRPSSLNNATANAAFIARELRRAHKKPRIVVAHSRGASELFLALLQNPELFETASIEKVIFVQGSFSGSPLAEWAHSLLSRDCGALLKTVLEVPCALARLLAHSAESLTPTVAMGLRVPLQRALSAEEQSLFQERAYFVRSRSTLSETQLGLKASALYLQQFYNGFHNDGILLSTQQRVRGFGHDLGVLEADHLSLLGNSKKESSVQIPFIRALLHEVLLP